MKKILLLAASGIFAFLMLHLLGQEKKQAALPLPQIIYHVDDTPLIPKTSRVGIDLGRWASSETSQLANNLLQNPGLEGQIERHIVIVSQADTFSFSDEAGLGYPNSDWNQAGYEIRTGRSAGKRGMIARSLNSGEHGFPQYFTEEPLPTIQPKDIIVLTKINRPDPADEWKTRYPNTTSIAPGVSRPRSEGIQSFKLSPTNTSKADLIYQLDYGPKNRGKGIKIEDKWRFRVWAKGERPNGELFVEFKRLNGTQPFFKTTLELTAEWQEYIVDFHGEDSGPPGGLILSITAFHPLNSVWIDDLFLGKLNQEKTPFRQEVVDALKELNPSFIREYPALGDTWENRIAPPMERKTWTQKTTGGEKQSFYSYSLPEFLSLCKEIGANPWLILPPAFSDQESKQYGHYLSQHATTAAFSDVVVEFGHENWNWLHRPTAIPYPDEQGKLARQLFGTLSNYAGPNVNLIKLANGPSVSAHESLQFLDFTSHADGLAIASYILSSLDRGTPDQQIFNEIFKNDTTSLVNIAAEVYSRDKSLALYAVNFNTVMGDASSYERNRIVASAVSGAALGKRLLESLNAGAHPVMVKNLAQLQTAAWETEGFVDLWGVVRDFGPPIRFRPTGLAIKLLNQTIQGALYQLTPQNADQAISQKLTLAAFKGDDSWSLAAVSESGQPHTIQIDWPDDEKALPSTAYFLKFQSPFDNNENADKVTIETAHVLTDHRSVYVTVPPWGLIVLGK